VGPALRWARALLVSAVAMLFGVTAHVGADGLLPGPVSLALLALLLLLAAARLLGRPASRVRVVLLLVAGQAFAHVFLTLSAGHRGDHARRAAGAGAETPTVPVLSPATGARESLYDQLYANRPEAPPARLSVPEPVHHLFADLGAHAWMAVAHLVAAAGVGLWLAYGERLLWTLVRLCAHGGQRVSRGLASAVCAARSTLTASLVVQRALLLGRCVATAEQSLVRTPQDPGLSPSVVRRGPPRVLPA
jgi:hypothetical protein